MPRTKSANARRLDHAAISDVFIPDKLYFRIGEVSKLTGTKPYVLRFWETQFPMLKPTKSKTGHRLYRRQEVEVVIQIKQLLYGKGFTISGARKHLSDKPKKDKDSEQGRLFQDNTGTAEFHFIRQELLAILTMLSRKC